MPGATKSSVVEDASSKGITEESGRHDYTSTTKQEVTKEQVSPLPYELPVTLVGITTIDGERTIILQIKENRYYLTMQPGKKLESLGIEILSIEGEEITLRSTKTGEIFLLSDLARGYRNKSGRLQETR